MWDTVWQEVLLRHHAERVIGNWGMRLLLASLVLANTAHAEDDKQTPRDPKDLIIVDDPDKYDEMIENLYRNSKVTDWPNWILEDGVIPQAWQGVSEIFPRGETRNPYGEVFAFKDGSWWTEDWIQYLPEDTMSGIALDIRYVGKGNVVSGLPYYEDLPNTDDYGRVHLRFQYKEPPPVSEIFLLPDLNSIFIDEVFRYDVMIVSEGVESFAGALHRERWQTWTGLGSTWRDTWVLWDNYTINPNPNPLTSSHEFRLVPIPSLNQTRKAFLLEQAGYPQKWHVTTTGTIMGI